MYPTLTLLFDGLPANVVAKLFTHKIQASVYFSPQTKPLDLTSNVPVIQTDDRRSSSPLRYTLQTTTLDVRVSLYHNVT